jgi:hypothetical protein
MRHPWLVTVVEMVVATVALFAILSMGGSWPVLTVVTALAAAMAYGVAIVRHRPPR